MNKERWKKFSKYEQLMMVAAELIRAKFWEKKNPGKYFSALERALSLVDSSLGDEKWRDNFLLLLNLREELVKYYTGGALSIDNLIKVF